MGEITGVDTLSGRFSYEHYNDIKRIKIVVGGIVDEIPPEGWQGYDAYSIQHSLQDKVLVLVDDDAWIPVTEGSRGANNFMFTRIPKEDAKNIIQTAKDMEREV